MSGYVKIFKVKEGNIKFMSFRIDNEKLLEKYKAIWTTIEDFKNIRLNALPVCDDRHIKTKIKTFGDNVYTNFRVLNVPEDDIECEPFSVIRIGHLLEYDKKYDLQAYLDNCAHKIINNKWQTTLIKIFLKIRYQMLAMLLLSLLKMLIVVVLYITLTKLKQFIY